MEFFNELGQLVYQHRKAAGLSRNQLSQLAGIGKDTIYKIEKTKANVRVKTLLKILAILNIKIEFKSPL